MTNRKTVVVGFTSLVAVLALRVADADARFYADLEIESAYTSNVYLNRSREGDAVITPSLSLGGDFADLWTAGYDGMLEVYPLHSDLLFHRHGAFLLVNPVFGSMKQNEIVAEAGVITQRNTDTYVSVNLLDPYLYLGLTMEPFHWFRWSISQRVDYRWFYDDTANDSLDSHTLMAITFTAQTKTTVSPRIGFGNRYYPHPDVGLTSDTSDQQLEAGIHLSQSIAAGAGLQADYAYKHAFGDSVLVLTNTTGEEFNYIGEAFLYTGHEGMLGYKQVFENGIRFGLEATVRYKIFGGWSAYDSLAPLTDNADRTDLQLEPAGWIEYAWWPDESHDPAAPSLTVGARYAYLRQWSNDYWYDTDRHLGLLSLTLSW